MERVFAYLLIFIVEGIIAWQYFEYLYEAKTSTLTRFLSFSVGYMLAFLTFLLDSIPVNAAVMCILNAFLARYNYGCGVKTAVFHGVFLEFGIVGTELLANLMLVALGYDFTAFTYSTVALLNMAIISKMMYLAITFLGAKLFQKQKHPGEEPGLIILFHSLPLFSTAAAILITDLGFREVLTRATEIMMVITITVLLVVNLLSVIVYTFMQKSNEANLALQLNVQKEQAETAYYKAMQEQSENQRILIHDIKNHLQAMAVLAKAEQNEKIQDYIASLTDTLTPMDSVFVSKNPILNMLLLRYREECKACGIALESDIRDGESREIDAADTTALYGNLLSNAFEAAQESQEKEIKLSVVYIPEQEITVISVVNSCSNGVKPDGRGGYHTTKYDGKLHGMGLKSIERVVKKYHGLSSMHYDRENKRFSHVIQLPEP